MALTGIEIFKLLPKTNCQECGVPTCMAFAVKLAAGQAELDSCPYVSKESREKLEEASAPPIRPVVIGSGEDALKIGGETVMFRHEKTFVNKPGIGLLVTDAMSDAELESRLGTFKALEYERVGLRLKADIVAVKDTSGDAGKFAGVVEKVKGAGIKNLVVMSDKTESLKAAVKAAAAAIAIGRPFRSASCATPGWAMITVGFFWNVAAIAASGTSCSMAESTCRPSAIATSSAPAARSCSPFTCGPPIRMTTSRPCFRYVPSASAW